MIVEKYSAFREDSAAHSHVSNTRTFGAQIAAVVAAPFAASVVAVGT